MKKINLEQLHNEVVTLSALHRTLMVNVAALKSKISVLHAAPIGSISFAEIVAATNEMVRLKKESEFLDALSADLQARHLLALEIELDEVNFLDNMPL